MAPYPARPRYSVMAGSSTGLGAYSLLRPRLPLLHYNGQFLLLVCAHTQLDRQTTFFVRLRSDSKNGRMVAGKLTRRSRHFY